MTEGERGTKAFVRVMERHGRMFVDVQGSDEKEIGMLKVRVEGLAAGERLGTEHWHATFMDRGQETFEKVLKETGALVAVDRSAAPRTGRRSWWHLARDTWTLFDCWWMRRQMSMP